LAKTETALALRRALEAAEAALAAGDAQAAERAAQRGMQVCEQLRARGERLEAGEASAALALNDRLLFRAQGLREELGRRLYRAGRSRRASAVYGRR